MEAVLKRVSATASACDQRLHGFIKKARTTPDEDLTLGAQAKEGSGAMSKKHMGSIIDDFLKKEGILEEAQAEVVMEIVAWQLAEAMKKEKISKGKWRGCSKRAGRKSSGC